MQAKGEEVLSGVAVGRTRPKIESEMTARPGQDLT